MMCFNLQDFVSHIKDGAEKIALMSRNMQKAEKVIKEFGKKVAKKAGEARRTVADAKNTN